MSKLNSVQSSFKLGEVSPRAYGNTDSPQYMEMVKELTNGYVIPQGGVQKRPGSQKQIYTLGNFVLESSGAVLHNATNFLTNYSFNYREWAYGTSDGKKWILIMNNGLQSTWNVYEVGAEKLWAMANRGNILQATLFELYCAPKYYVGGTSETFAAIDLEEIQIEQAGDTLFLTHAGMAPMTIRYRLSAHYDVTLASNFNFPTIARYDMAYRDNLTLIEDVEFHQTIPFLEENSLNNNNMGSLTYPAVAYALGDNAVLTATVAIFNAAWVGSYIRVNNYGTAASGLFYIHTYTNSTHVTAYAMQAVPVGGVAYGTAANTSWSESAWSPRKGYPSAVCAFGSRILYGGTPSNPNRVWASAVGDVDELCEIPYIQDPEYATYLTDESRAYSFDIQGCDLIRWMNSGKRIFIGARNREFVAYGSSGVLGPATTVVDTAGAYGSAYRNAFRVGSEIIHVQRSKQRLRGIQFSFQEDDYKSQDISKLAEHIARSSENTIDQTLAVVPSFNSSIVATSPDTRIWNTDNNGGLNACTFDREGGVVAWSRHILGGVGFMAGDLKPYVCSAATLPSYDNSADEIYLMVKRKINGASVVILEKIGGYFNEPTYTNSTFSPAAGYADWLRTRAIFLDCAMGSYSAGGSVTHTFASLLNETVDVVADGAHLGQYTLNGSGVLTLPVAYHEVIVGYHADTVIELMDFEIPNANGSNQAKPKVAQQVWLKLNRTANAMAQRSGQTDWQRVKLVFDSQASDGPVGLFTGDVQAHIGGVQRGMSIKIKADKPLPFELLAVTFQGFIYD